MRRTQRLSAALAVLVWLGSRGYAEGLLATSNVQGGLIVHLGSGDGALTAKLGARENTLVHGLDSDPAAVEAARKRMRAVGLSSRVSVMQWDDATLPYADDLVNLFVAESLGDVPMAEVLRVLRPRGVARIREGGTWTTTVKPWPADMDEWTHFRYGPEGNMVSRDRRVGPPRYLRWTAGPEFQRHHGVVPSITSLVSAGGRLFAIIEEAPTSAMGLRSPWSLVARDGFNGLLLWKRPVPDWGSEAWSYWREGHSARFNHPIHVRKRLVASGDRVYVTLGFNAPVTCLDAATGKTVRTYEGTAYTDAFVLHGGVLYLVVNDRAQKPWPGEGVQPEPARKEALSEKRVWAVEAGTGTVRWKSDPFTGNPSKPDRMAAMHHLNLTVSDDGVFLVDTQDIVCLDRATGGVRWRSPRLVKVEPPERTQLVYLYHSMVMANLHTLVAHRGILLVMHPQDHLGWKWTAPAILQALSAETGRELWRKEATPINYIDKPDLFAIGDLVWVADRKAQTLVAFDLATGEKKREHSVKKALNVRHHHRCYPNRASERYIITGRRGAEFVDVETGEVTLHHWARTACRVGHLLANGLFYRPPDHCRCYTSFQPRGFLALAARGRAVEPTHPLEKGLAYSSIGNRPFDGAQGRQSQIANPSDWPTWRHDPFRSCSASTEVSPPVTLAWQAPIGSGATSAVIADGRAYVCSKDEHRVQAIDASTGKPAWSFTAGGPVDSPPTIHDGLALFGCRDGWVYCLRAEDGALVWRFRAAPAERRIVAFGEVESPWPVNGSVLVVGGNAYIVAGRSSLLDDGVTAFVLGARTGKPIERKQLHEVQTDTLASGKLPQAGLPDILVTDGLGVYMRNLRLPFETPLPTGLDPAMAQLQPRLVASAGFANAQWFHRMSWSLGRSATGYQIAFDGRMAYGADTGGSGNMFFYVPAGGDRSRVIGGPQVKAASWLRNVKVTRGGYILTAKPHGRARGAGKGTSAARGWQQEAFPICPWAMVVAGKTLWVAGFPDAIDLEDPWATFEGRRGGVLRALSTEDGSTLFEAALESPPVWNGMAAARGRLYLSTREGRLLCFAPKGR